MPIHGLTTGVNIQKRAVRIGWLKKGELRTTGKTGRDGRPVTKPTDLEHFRFTGVGPDAAAIEAAFVEVYGAQPVIIPDVRIPVSIAGNFDIQEAAYLVANGYLQNGDKKLPVLMGKSDGRRVLMMRDPSDGSKFLHDLDYEAVTSLDRDGKPCLRRGENLYPWRAEMKVDLVLVDLSRVLYERGLAGHGVVTLTTHSLNDIPSLIREYEEILDAGVSAFMPGFSNYDQAKRYLPLERVPIRLSRQAQTITTPDYRQGAPKDARLVVERSLLHWQLAPEFAAARLNALDASTSHMLDALASGRRYGGNINADLLGIETLPQIEAGTPAEMLPPKSDESAVGYIDEEEPNDDGDDETTTEYVAEATPPAPAPDAPRWSDEFIDYCSAHIGRYKGNPFMVQNALRKLFPDGPATDKIGARQQFEALKAHAAERDAATN